MPSPIKPTVVCTILAGGNREHLILDAVASVCRFVSCIILVNTGPSADKAIEAVIREYGDLLTIEVVDLPENLRNPFITSQARNFCLWQADGRATFCLILDTDERLQNTDNILEKLDDCLNAEYCTVRDNTGTYTKARFIRLPAKGRYVGDPHEAYCEGVTEFELPSVRFCEVPKSKEEQDARMTAVAKDLFVRLCRQPDDARAHYYYADAVEYLGKDQDAINHWSRCNSLTLWEEERVWSIFRIARNYWKRGLYREALKALSEEVYSLPETAWLAALCAYSLDRPTQAIDLAEHAIRLSSRARKNPRRGFSCPAAYYWGPYDVLRHAHAKLDNQREVEQYDKLYQGALEQMRADGYV